MRLFGLETEYGVIDPRNPRANPIRLSADLVSAVRELWPGRTSRWDYGGEDPLQDQRGMRRRRDDADFDLLTDAVEFDAQAGQVLLRRRRGSWEDPAHLNAVLPNGGRFYVDHAHPEYSGPEVTSAMDVVLWDSAGDRIALAAAQKYTEITGDEMHLYKNNVDGKGATYGTHENYLIPRGGDFEQFSGLLFAHLVTRQVYCGSGRVGIGTRGEQAGFQISQRADYIESEIALETTMNRPIVNSRDEPHADRNKFRRLHLIIGDANNFQVANYLKVGTTALILAAIQAHDERLATLRLKNPVAMVREVSRDLSLNRQLLLASGETASALTIQRALLEIAKDYADSVHDNDVLARWEQVLDKLGRDIFAAAAEVEWIGKLKLLGRLSARFGQLGAPYWADPRLLAADLQWSQLGQGWAAKMVAAGEVTTLVSEEQVIAATQTPPADTRAALRGKMVSRANDIVDAAGWATVVLDRDTHHGQLEVVPLLDPWQYEHPVLTPLIPD